MARTWNDLVVAGRAAAEQEKGARWALGDLAAEVAKSEADGRLIKYADEIGVAYETLRTYREVAVAWPPHRRRDVTWSIMRELIHREDRFRLLDEMIAAYGERMTVNQAREHVGKKSAGVRTTSSAKERARLVAEHLADKAVADELARSFPGSVGNVAAATARRRQDSRQQDDRDMAENHPGLDDIIGRLTIENAIEKAATALREALTHIQQQGQVDVVDQDVTRERLAKVRVLLDWLDSLVGGASIDEELERLLGDAR